MKQPILNPSSESPASRDPVCGMTVDPATAAAHATHEGVDYHFCNPGCAQKFKLDPNKYLKPQDVAGPDAKESSNERGIWTCPMHPEVRNQGPGSCPICGMS
jgi:Cu+-exporting ATPase